MHLAIVTNVRPFFEPLVLADADVGPEVDEVDHGVLIEEEDLELGHEAEVLFGEFPKFE